MRLVRFPSSIALVLLLSALPASADSILFDIQEFEGELLWWRSYDGPGSYTEYGGPKTVTVQLPDGVTAIQSVRVVLLGDWTEGCVDTESGGGCWVPTLYLSGGCVDIQLNPGAEGLAGFDRVFTECDFGVEIGQEFSLTIWTDRVDTNPTTSGGGIPSVYVHAVHVTYEVNVSVDAVGERWSALKSRFREARRH